MAARINTNMIVGLHEDRIKHIELCSMKHNEKKNQHQELKAMHTHHSHPDDALRAREPAPHSTLV